MPIEKPKAHTAVAKVVSSLKGWWHDTFKAQKAKKSPAQEVYVKGFTTLPPRFISATSSRRTSPISRRTASSASSPSSVASFPRTFPASRTPSPTATPSSAETSTMTWSGTSTGLSTGSSTLVQDDDLVIRPYTPLPGSTSAKSAEDPNSNRWSAWSSNEELASLARLHPNFESRIEWWLENNNPKPRRTRRR